MATTRAGRDDHNSDRQQVITGKTYLLGIGIDQYQSWPRLRNAVRDVQVVSELLITDYGLQPENTYTLYDGQATRAAIIHALEDMADRVSNADSLIVYYAGHGHLNDRKRGYWVPADAPRDGISYYISNSTIRDYLGDIKSLHTLLISDACFSGSLFVRGQRSGNLAAHELAKLSSRWAICSGRHDEVVADGPEDGHSPFAESIIDVLQKTERSVITTNFLFEQVREQTRANYDQLPDGGPIQGVGHKRGQYVFQRSKELATAPIPSQEPSAPIESVAADTAVLASSAQASGSESPKESTPNTSSPAAPQRTTETGQQSKAGWIIGGMSVLLALVIVWAVSYSWGNSETKNQKNKAARLEQALYQAMRNRDAVQVKQLEQEYQALPSEVTNELLLTRADKWMTQYRDSMSRLATPPPTDKAEGGSSKTRYLVHSDIFKTKGEAAEVLNEMRQLELNQLEIIELRPNRFVVKVGILDDRTDAQAFVGQLKAKGFATYIREEN